MATTRHPEELLQKIGGCGRFQKLLSIVTHLLKFPTVMAVGLMVFSIATPKWWCVDNLTIKLLYNSSSNQSSLTYRVFHTPMSNISFDKNMMNASLVSARYDSFKNCKNSNGSQCNTIKYSEEMETIVTEWSMSCHLSWIPSTIASVQMIGIFIGNILSGHIADMFGRKIPIFGSLIVLIIANLIAYFANSWMVFGAARTLSGLGMGTFLTAQYSLATEVSLSKWRPMIIVFPSWASMACVVTLVNYLLPNWRKMHLLAAIVTVPFLVSWKFVPESFRWHLSHDRFKEAKDIIHRIAKFNGERVSDETLMEFLHTTKEGIQGGDKKKYTVFHLFKKRYLVKTTLFSATNWLALGLLTYGIQFGVQSLSGNFFLNMFLFGIIGVPTSFISVRLCNTIGRRKTVAFTYIMATAGCLAVGIVQHIDTPARGPLTNGFAMFACLGIGIAWGPVQLMTLELYPTVVRNIGYGFCNTFARIGAVLGPQLAFLDTRIPGLMYFICSGVGVCCVIGTFFLDETKGVVLDDKIRKSNKQEFVMSIIDEENGTRTDTNDTNKSNCEEI